MENGGNGPALILTALDQSGAERIIVPGKSFSLGRGPDNDWVIADAGREVSKTHCRIEALGSSFVLVDLSVNGIQIEGQSGLMGPGGRHRLVSGDQFALGPYRFAVAFSAASERRSGPRTAMLNSVSDILDGGPEGTELRTSAGISDDAGHWLGVMPKGSAEDTLCKPLGWEEPPSTGAFISPLKFDHSSVSDFVNRSEHMPAPNHALRLPRAQQLIAPDWMEGTDKESDTQSNNLSSAKDHEVPAVTDVGLALDARHNFAQGGRLDATTLSMFTDDVLFQRCGELLRALLDGFDMIEAGQAVAEHDCGLPVPGNHTPEADFLIANRDPLLTFLAVPQSDSSNILAQRLSALANRQRALGEAVAEAATRYEARLAPASIAADAEHGFHFGPFAKAAAWTRFVGLHANLTGQSGKEGGSSPFLTLLRESFGRAVAKRL